MRRALTAVAGAAAAIALSVPVAHAATKFEFEDVTFPDGQTGTIYASVKEMNNKDDNVYCLYQSSAHEFLGISFVFLPTAPTEADAVLAFCLANFDQRRL